jgi:cardiolipin synthase
LSRGRIEVNELLKRRVNIFGMPTPAGAIAAVVMAMLIASTVWGILFTRAPQNITQHIEHRYDVSSPQFLRSMGVLLGPPLEQGNRVDALVNGKEIFPAMLDAIRGAKRSITFESYIYWKGDIGKKFGDALAERARAGVKVHVLLDWAGSHKMDQETLNEIGRAGGVITKYHRPQWYSLSHLNHRTHRKLLIVDGAVGFTGGVGIADEWTGNAQDEKHWRDTHFRIVGPAVAQLQGTFNDNWTQATGQVLDGEDYFPQLKAAGTMSAQMFKSSIEGGAESMQLMYLLSIAAAKSSIDISMAYFLPDDLTTDHVIAALKRGVRVRVILPGDHNDSQLVRAASRSSYGRILAAGGEIYEYEPTMYHCKVLVVDGRWVSVGSTNFDSRSFRLNDEANLNVYDEGFAALQVAQFERDLARTRRVTLKDWQSRPASQKAWDHIVAFFGPEL